MFISMDDRMEVDLVPSGLSEEDTVGLNDFDNEISNFEGERCGICMDIIIDRGVLDCCQHWFCFVCIDNWASITNLCPLCQNEFQLITCVPVYDTTGTSNVDDDSFSRDDDWSIEGKNNTVSFPSYYIDENAVICLDGDGCKIRNGSASIEGDPNLDTSIACDSCDIWYHAFCVGFDTEDTSETTWLCPRCIGNEPQTSSVNLVLIPHNQFGLEDANDECLVEEGFSRKLSVSVADAGETAVVVSMVGGNEVDEDQSENLPPTLEIDRNLKTETFILASEVNGQTPATSLKEETPTQSIVGAKELEIPLSCSDSYGLPSNPSMLSELKTSSADGSVTEPCNFASIKVEYSNNNGKEDHWSESSQHQNSFEEYAVRADKDVSDCNQEATGIVGTKRKLIDCSEVDLKSADIVAIKTKTKNQAATKKARAEGRNQLITSKNQSKLPNSDANERCSAMIGKELDVATDIMHIVRGTDRKPSKEIAGTNSDDKSLNGLRVKKIMRRADEDKESSILVEKLRKQIREAVRNKASKDIGENLFDTKLLAAFRAAVTGPKTEPMKTPSLQSLKAKKSMLQKGKVRDSLTKKIYATTNGRRKRAWDRDCEVEFWKHRCMRAGKPEKIATLKSVLDLLRTSSDGSVAKRESEYQPSNPILSRLYLADTSVFPRKDDIKPLSALKPASNSMQNKEQSTSVVKCSKPSLESCTPSANKASPSGHSTAPTTISSKVKSQTEVSVKSIDTKIDKRKWALDVLARKTADTGKNATTEKQENTALLKGNFPLLAQLPVDMRPVLAPSRHNKVPVSVRQMQLHRLTEHLLRKTNLPVMDRTAATELAVADAVNIEKVVVDGSNSKIVYLNLVSQEIAHRSDDNKSDGATKSDPLHASDVHFDRSERDPGEPIADPVIEEALKNAGLLSDSPPSSPSHKTDVWNEDDNDFLKRLSEEEPENVIEDFCPDLDIYGDFEYDLEGEDYVGPGATRITNQPLAEGESKLKVIFSTLTSDKPSNSSEFEETQKLGNVESPKESSCSLKNDTEVGTVNEPIKIETEESCVPLDPLLAKEEEATLAECEELYGPEKDTSIKEFPEEVLAKLRGTDSGTSVLIQAGKESVLESENAKNVSPKRKETSNSDMNEQSNNMNHVTKKVEAYIKEHIRPLCKSGVITSQQYRWAVAKTTDKVMKYHSKDKTANFLIKEGEKVKKLAEQYVEAAQQKGKIDL